MNEKITQSIVTYQNNSAIDFKDVEILQKIQKRHFKKGEFYMQSFEFDKLVLAKKYSGLTIRVLTALKLRYDFNNYIKYFTQKMLASEINSTQPKISEALKILKEDEIIIFDEDKNLYYFNQKFFKGAGD